MAVNSGSTCPVSALHHIVLEKIFSYLEVRDLAAVTGVCKLWHSLADSPRLWQDANVEVRPDSLSPISLAALTRRRVRHVVVSSNTECEDLKNLLVGLTTMETLVLSDIEKEKKLDFMEVFDQKFPKLKVLRLVSSRVDDDDMQCITEYANNLEELDLESCPTICNVTLSLIGSQAKKLKRLSVKSCDGYGDYGIGFLSGLGPPQHYFGGRAKLRELTLSNAPDITDKALCSIRVGFPTLKVLNIDCCPGITDEGFQQLAKIRTLRELSAERCDITDEGMQFLCLGKASLVKLNVSYCSDITDDCLLTVARRFQSLQHLAVGQCLVSEANVLQLIKILPDLKRLDFSLALSPSTRKAIEDYAKKSEVRVIFHDNCVLLKRC